MPALPTSLSRPWLGVGFALWLACGTAAADDKLAQGAVQLGISGGYSVPFQFGDADAEVGMSEFGVLMPRVGVGVTELIAPDRWYRGSFTLELEGQLLFQREPRSGFGGGAELLVRYHWRYFEKIVPFSQLGAGIMHLDFDLERRQDGFNFSLHGGHGVQWFVWDRTAITAEWRYHHISNAGLDGGNRAVDSSLFLLGATVYFDSPDL